MAAAFVQRWTAAGAGGSFILSITVSGATANNLLVSTIATQVGGGPFSVSTGWTIIQESGSVDASLFGGAIAYRIATGDSNDDITWTIADGGRRAGQVVEYSGLSTTPLDTSNENNSTSDVTSLSTGSVTPSSQPGLAVAHFAGEKESMFTAASQSIDSSFTNIRTVQSGLGNAAIVFTAEYLFSALSALNPTWSTTDTGGKCYASIALFSEPAGASNDLVAALSAALTVSPTVSGSGALASALNSALDATANLLSVGSLSASKQLQLTLAGQLIADGSLAAALPLVASLAADVTDTGVNDLVASLQGVLTLAADVAATGDMSATLSILATVAAQLNAPGQLDSALDLNLFVTPTLGAEGLLTAALDANLVITPSVTALGGLDASLSTLLVVSATFASDNNLVAVLPTALTMSSALQSVGGLAAAMDLELTIAPFLESNNPPKIIKINGFEIW